jgi:hypothetical protein
VRFIIVGILASLAVAWIDCDAAQPDQRAGRCSEEPAPLTSVSFRGLSRRRKLRRAARLRRSDTRGIADYARTR